MADSEGESDEEIDILTNTNDSTRSVMFTGVPRPNQYPSSHSLGHLGGWQQRGTLADHNEQQISRDEDESDSNESESSSESESESEEDEEKDIQRHPVAPIRDIHPIRSRLDSNNSQDALSSPKDGSLAKKQRFEERFWEESPEVYGIRRSGRARKEPERFHITLEGSDDAEEESGGPVRKTKGGRKNAKRARRISSSEDWPTHHSNDSTPSDSSDDYTPKITRPRPQPRARARAAANELHPPVPRTKSTHSALNKSSILHKEQMLDSDESDSEDEGSRNSLRRAAMNITSYKEESEDETDSEDIVEGNQEWQGDYVEDDRETIERVLLNRVGRPGEIGAITTIYAPDYEIMINREDPDPEKEATEVQFLIKWKGWSHLHNTWESENSLVEQNVKGMKKLYNFIKRDDDIKAWKKLACPEDIEYFEVQQQMNSDLIDEYKEVERIISHTTVKNVDEFGNIVNQVDYLSKWQGLPYGECTWEDGALISRFFQNEIDGYLNRERSEKIPTKSAKVLRQRPKFLHIKKQPSYIGSDEKLRLRDYQLDGLNWLVNSWCKSHSIILADEMGLGKTIQVIAFLSHLFHSHALYGPFIIVVPLSTMAGWQREFVLWSQQLNVVVYLGDITSRNKIREFEFYHKNGRLKFNVLLTTYEILLKDKQTLGTFNWAGLVVDEAHRLKNDDSLLYKALQEFHTNHRLLVTGTPLQNSLKELWALLHILMPDRFSSWESFECIHATQEQKDKGFSSLHKELEPFLLRRVKKDVEKSLPAKVEQILRVEMSSLQKKYYRWILTKNFKALNKGLKGNTNSFLNIVMELKKCCNHAFLTRPDFIPPGVDPLQNLICGSGKLFLLDKLLVRLKETGHRVLIFSQMVRMLDLLAEYLQRRRFFFQRLDGSIRGDVRKQALDHFNAEGSEDFCFLLSTRAGGLGINLATADTVIIFDSDWNPQNDLQAQARAHRIGQRNQVNIYRLVSKGSVEEEIIERAKRKMVLDHLIIQRMDTTGRKVLSKSSAAPSTTNPFNKDELASILKFGAEDLFKEGDGEQDLQLQEMDIDEILRRAETRDSDDQPQTIGEELLSQFKMANFAMDEDAITTPEPIHTEGDEDKKWENIIPEGVRQKLKEEEQQKEQLALYLPPRSRKAVKKMNYDSEGEPRARKKPSRKKKSESESGDDGSDVDGKETKRKRGRPRTIKREDVEGFGDSEIRRFVKSYKKFGRPRTRLNAIAADAELEDKSQDEIVRLANTLHDGCIRAVKEYEEKLQEDANFDGKKRGATLRIGNVTINAPSILKHEEELESLAAAIPADPEEKKKYRLTLPAKSVHWGVPWDVSDDSMLLVGIFEHGMGSWEAIKANQELGLAAKILPPGNLKPQDKHLQTRAEYLVKLLRQVVQESKAEELRKSSVKIKSKIKRLGKKKDTKKKPSSEDASPSSTAAPSPMPVSTPPVQQETKERGEGGEVSKQPNPTGETKKRLKKKPGIAKKQDQPLQEEKEKPPKEGKKEKEKEEEKKKSPVIEEPASPDTQDDHVQLASDMEKEIFDACKEKMRPVKRALKMLESPEDSMAVKDQVAQTRQCLLKIGDHILDITSQYKEHAVASEWRGNLWTFVSKFTAFEAKKLFKLYRHATKKRDDQRQQQQRAYHKTKQDAPSSGLPRKTSDQSGQRPKDLKRSLDGLSLPAPATKIPKLANRNSTSSGSSRYTSGNTEPGNESRRGGYGERSKDRPPREGHDDRQRYHERDRDRSSSYYLSEHPRSYERSSDHSWSKDQHSRSYERSSEHNSRTYEKSYDKSYEKTYRRDDHHRSGSRDYSSDHRHHSYSHRTSSESSRHSGQSPHDGLASPRTPYEGRKHFTDEKRFSLQDKERDKR